MMRTTLTLDDDVAAQLGRARKRYRGKLRDLINEALRAGLARLDEPRISDEPFQTRSVDLGRIKLANLDDIAEVLSIAEGDDFK